MTNRLNNSEMNAAIIKLKYCEPIKKPEIGTISKKNALNRIKNPLTLFTYK